MARGQQKIQSQQKAAAKQAALKKQKGRGSKDQENAAKAALKITCQVCKISMMNAQMYKQHWEAKHSKLPLPKEAQA